MEHPFEISIQYHQLGDAPIDKTIFAEDKSWRFDFGGMNKEEVTSLLNSDMPEFEDESLQRLGSYLLDATPIKLVCTDTNVWLHLEPQSKGHPLFLSCAGCPPDIKRCFSGNKFASQFLEFFSELRTELPGNAGAFNDHCVRMKDWVHERKVVSDEWKEAFSFYHASDGDCLFVRDDGKVAWDIMAEGRISEFDESLSDVVSAFVTCLKTMGSFDFYKFEEIIKRA